MGARSSLPSAPPRGKLRSVRFLRDEDAVVRETPGGWGRLWLVGRNLLVTEVAGRSDAEMARVYTRHADRVLERAGSLVVFHHWLAVTAWEPAGRDELRGWAAKKPRNAIDAHFLVGSKVLAMAIEVAGLMLRREMLAYADERTFEADLRDAIVKAR